MRSAAAAGDFIHRKCGFNFAGSGGAATSAHVTRARGSFRTSASVALRGAMSSPST